MNDVTAVMVEEHRLILRMITLVEETVYCLCRQSKNI